MTMSVELPSATTGLARSLSQTAGRPGWVRDVAAQLADVRTALLDHIRVTEGPTGRYAQLLRDAPRLAPGIHELVTEHAELIAALDDARPDDDPQRLHEAVTGLVDRLGRHRQHGADLIYEAYSIDVGGET
ncbi:hypothetical protein F4553_003579 [Allocatelliglobosispora scoriae]|uniref:Hemerythrin-like domain-containing protein n=1 Tax=Allocatelliglobosispora scoriae TaxID=643052 RepID=A0A841BTU6_9ACTN|nr:hypothetical protein [Allocatelliglobosispora scoriae]MBB5870200.1 hypothetical protein [Allocatelliglobosispora scoriae]